MMPVDFEGSNITLGKPDGWTDEQCTSIRAMQGVDTNGAPYFLTKWMPSKEDIEAINAGRGFWVQTYGMYFQPVLIVTMDENDEIN